MPEPFTLAVLGVAAATEGIKFLYAQASETLRRRREHKDVDTLAADSPTTELARPDILIGDFSVGHINDDALDRLAAALQVATEELRAASLSGIDLQDADLNANFNLVRRILEVVHGQTITFRGESRPPSGPVVVSQVQIDEVAGSAKGIVAQRMRQGRVESVMKSGRIERGGEITGVQIDEIG